MMLLSSRTPIPGRPQRVPFFPFLPFRPFFTSFTFFTFFTFCCSAAAAQDRRMLSRDDPQAQLMGYYAAALAFTPSGLPDARGRWEIGGAIGFIPGLSEEERSVGFGGTKTEASNACPVFPRVFAGRGFGRVSVEAGYTPPVTVCGAQANVLALAVAIPLELREGRWNAVVRLAGQYGGIEGSITCDEDAVADPADQTCFGGTPSDDKLGLTQVEVDGMLVYEGWSARRLRPYVLFGTRVEWLRFDVNYTRTNATPPPGGVPALDDHEQFGVNLFRVQMGGGMSWDIGGRLRLGGELIYAPGALFTARGRATIALGSGR